MRDDPRQTAMAVSLLVSFLMLAGKLTAYSLTHSFALLADAAESLVHGVATGLATFSVWYAARPADSGHPYGHGRIAYFSAGFEGALVLAAAITVTGSGVIGLLRGPQLRNLGWGLTIAGLLAAVNLVLGLWLVHVGRTRNAIIVAANGHHVLSDMWTSVAAIVGVALVAVSGLTWPDPAVAVLIGVYIGATGLAMIRRSFGGLMDELDPASSQRLVACLEQSVDEGLITGYHQLRGRRLNDELWVDVHMLVRGDLTTRASHERVTQVEHALQALFPEERVRISTHIEPADHEAAHPDGHPDVRDPLKSREPGC